LEAIMAEFTMFQWAALAVFVLLVAGIAASLWLAVPAAMRERAAERREKRRAEALAAQQEQGGA